MHRIVYFSFLLITLQAVKSDPIPPECMMPPPEVSNPSACCILPQVFKEDDFKDCNINLPFNENLFKTGSPDCTEQKCLLKKYNVMKDDNNIDKDALLTFMDKFTEANADFKEATEKAKEICVKSDHPPPIMCEATETFFCIGQVMFIECPKWEDTNECNIMKDHNDRCKALIH